MPTVGEVLRAEREKKGLTVKDIEAGTSIRAIYLTAIEEGNYKVVPGEVYLKGFIRNYANFIGLNAQEMIELYRQGLASQTEPEAVSKQEPVAAQPQEKQAAAAATRSSEHKAGASHTPSMWITAGVLLIAVAGGAWWFTQTSQPGNPSADTQPPISQPSAPSPQTPGVPQPNQAAQPAPAIPAAPGKPVSITAKYTGESWTLVTADGKEIYEGIPKVGETLTWSADKSVVIKVGNAAAVELAYNGNPVGRLGENGEVVVRTFSANANEKKP